MSGSPRRLMSLLLLLAYPLVAHGQAGTSAKSTEPFKLGTFQQQGRTFVGIVRELGTDAIVAEEAAAVAAALDVLALGGRGALAVLALLLRRFVGATGREAERESGDEGNGKVKFATEIHLDLPRARKSQETLTGERVGPRQRVQLPERPLTATHDVRRVAI